MTKILTIADVHAHGVTIGDTLYVAWTEDDPRHINGRQWQCPHCHTRQRPEPLDGSTLKVDLGIWENYEITCNRCDIQLKTPFFKPYQECSYGMS